MFLAARQWVCFCAVKHRMPTAIVCLFVCCLAYCLHQGVHLCILSIFGNILLNILAYLNYIFVVYCCVYCWYFLFTYDWLMGRRKKGRFAEVEGDMWKLSHSTFASFVMLWSVGRERQYKRRPRAVTRRALCCWDQVGSDRNNFPSQRTWLKTWRPYSSE